MPLAALAAMTDSAWYAQRLEQSIRDKSAVVHVAVVGKQSKMDG